ncbi:putative transporter, Major facilitator superfamily MFS_1 [Cupriavidus taiwanensis]|nr:putative transporter, Major facilitator superfamily MFS_1 [Cupriavidus taiwanensis]SOZ20424.1 putative transporter, Major facilitator superfamily MFS_1 [Cupriavidus taiwanensis]SOZ41175.1 putative transporter, Major facilitator superfamily MFS_1 [Cupriavidus taiwanensis]SOZ97387.1 putative transporter, Major facilitator superfamily MFS_1 [Cupriavidus taiwanensis]SPA10465.1 putative transporter, Major facilitator superfamily MFS_1 [Cupriavidus taiwanensis]
MAGMDSRLVTLCVGNFVIGTGAMIVTGMLNDIAGDFGLGAASAGQLISVFALATCVGAPLFATLGSRIDRRLLLAGSLLVYGVMHVAAALAPSFAALMAIRFLTAIGAAIYTPQTAATLPLLVNAQTRGRAISFVFLGWSIASVVGVPLGTWISSTLGWRVSMALVGVMALLVAAAVWRALPRGLMVPPAGREAWGAVLRHKPVMLVVLTTMISSAGMFTLFTYIAPLMRDVHGISGGALSLMFLAYGACGVFGNAMAASRMDRVTPSRIVQVTLLTSITAMVLWPLAGLGSVALVALFMLWGVGGFATNSAQQARLVLLAPERASVSISLNSSSIYLGQAAGAMAGAAIYTLAGPDTLHWGAAALMLAALAVSQRARLLGCRWQPAQAARQL